MEAAVILETRPAKRCVPWTWW